MPRDNRPTILLVDDNPQIRSFIRPALEDGGFRCIEAVDGDEAIYYAETSHPDLVVLDIELGDPELDGLDVCSRIRNMGLKMPVIFLTVRATVDDLDRGLHIAGPGSDYVRKLEELRRLQVGGEELGNVQIAFKAPDTRELLARIRARLPMDLQQLGPFLRIDRKRRNVDRLEGETWVETSMQPMEYDVFSVLVDANGAVVGTWELSDRIFESVSNGPDNSDESIADSYRSRIWVCIANLRKKIDPNGLNEYIHTVHGIGYRFSSGDPD